MSLQLAVALNVAFDVFLLAGLAYLMSTPRHLRPHVRQIAHRVHEEIEKAGHLLHQQPSDEVIAD